MTGLAPKGLFLDNIIRVGRKELQVECDYIREADNQTRFKQWVEQDEELQKQRFHVPEVIQSMSTRKILTSEFCPGATIDVVASQCDSSERNRIGRAILYLTMKELFCWRFMQTDPNWGNFLYDSKTQTTYLVGEYPIHFFYAL
jgi:aarF domain-containing kinase